jgi:hypothetical protein
MVRCGECSGSGACDPCDGYGYGPDSWPNAGDGTECGVCEGTGLCPECHGTGSTSTCTDTAVVTAGIESESVRSA